MPPHQAVKILDPGFVDQHHQPARFLGDDFIPPPPPSIFSYTGQKVDASGTAEWDAHPVTGSEYHTGPSETPAYAGVWPVYLTANRGHGSRVWVGSRGPGGLSGGSSHSHVTQSLIYVPQAVINRDGTKLVFKLQEAMQQGSQDNCASTQVPVTFPPPDFYWAVVCNPTTAYSATTVSLYRYAPPEDPAHFPPGALAVEELLGTWTVLLGYGGGPAEGPETTIILPGAGWYGVDVTLPPPAGGAGGLPGPLGFYGNSASTGSQASLVGELRRNPPTP